MATQRPSGTDHRRWSRHGSLVLMTSLAAISLGAAGRQPEARPAAMAGWIVVEQRSTGCLVSPSPSPRDLAPGRMRAAG